MKLGLDALPLVVPPRPVDLIQSIIDTPIQPIVLPDSIPEAKLTEDELETIRRLDASCKAFDERCDELETDFWEE